MYSGWELTPSTITSLKKLKEPVHPDFIGHHITYMFGPDSTAPEDKTINVIGHLVTDKIQCFVVEVDGTIVRPDGAIYHITWSIDRSKGAKPVDCNLALKLHGFEVFGKVVNIEAKPKLFKW